MSFADRYIALQTFIGRVGMKHCRFMLLLTGLLAGCNPVTAPDSTEHFLIVELESAFENDSVTVVLDDEVLLNRRVTTDYSINMAWSSNLRVVTGVRHTLHATMAEKQLSTTFTANLTADTTSMLVEFDAPNNQLTVRQVDGLVFHL
jgi:hypothetical protein